MATPGSPNQNPALVGEPHAIVPAPGEGEVPDTSPDVGRLQNRALRHCMTTQELELGDMYELSGLSGVLRWAHELYSSAHDPRPG